MTLICIPPSCASHPHSYFSSILYHPTPSAVFLPNFISSHLIHILLLHVIILPSFIFCPCSILFNNIFIFYIISPHSYSSSILYHSTLFIFLFYSIPVHLFKSLFYSVPHHPIHILLLFCIFLLHSYSSSILYQLTFIHIPFLIYIFSPFFFFLFLYFSSILYNSTLFIILFYSISFYFFIFFIYIYSPLYIQSPLFIFLT